MTRIKETFDTLKSQNRKALITFIMGGDPDFETSVDILKSLPEAGADLIEIGMPFSDPMADGPVIQRASERALEHNVSMTDVFGMVKSLLIASTFCMGFAATLSGFSSNEVTIDSV